MAIDIKSLRIGSHILVNGVRARVEQLSTLRYDKNEAFHLLVRGISPDTGEVGEVGCFVNDEAVEPIAITPELLKELGFKNRREGIWQHWWKDGFYLEHRDECEYWHFHGDIGVRYFHELESLYYKIYETELIPD